jgi:hypothetical protein
MGKQKKMNRCALCDEWYSPDDIEAARIHSHPEPQGGVFRTAWLESKLPYDKWTKETEEGKAWKEHVSWFKHKPWLKQKTEKGGA